MSTSTIVKVTVDTPCTMQVTGISEAAGQFGPQLKIDGTDGNGGVTVYEKLERVDEQLRRAGLDRHSVIGKTITLFKEMASANGKTFPALRISVVGAAVAAPSNGTAKQAISQGPPLPYEETGAPPKGRTDIPASFALYDRCFEHAYKVASAAKIADPQAIASMAATLYIQANK
jgi:hypothetical protein